MAPTKTATITKVGAKPSPRPPPISFESRTKQPPQQLLLPSEMKIKGGFREPLPSDGLKRVAIDSFTDAFREEIWNTIKKEPEGLKYHDIVNFARHKEQQIENRQAEELFARLREEKLGKVKMAEETDWKRVMELAKRDVEKEKSKREANERTNMAKKSAESAESKEPMDNLNSKGKRKMVADSSIVDNQERKSSHRILGENMDEEMDTLTPSSLVIAKKGERTNGHQAVIRQVSDTTGKDTKRQKIVRSSSLRSFDEAESSKTNGHTDIQMGQRCAEDTGPEYISDPVTNQIEVFPTASKGNTGLMNHNGRRGPSIKLTLDIPPRMTINGGTLVTETTAPDKQDSLNSQAKQPTSVVPNNSQSPTITEASESKRLGRPLTARERLLIRQHNIHQRISYADISLKAYPHQLHETIIEQERLARREVRQRAEYAAVLKGRQSSAAPSYTTETDWSPIETETSSSEDHSPTDTANESSNIPVAIYPLNGNITVPGNDIFGIYNNMASETESGDTGSYIDQQGRLDRLLQAAQVASELGIEGLDDFENLTHGSSSRKPSSKGHKANGITESSSTGDSIVNRNGHEGMSELAATCQKANNDLRLIDPLLFDALEAIDAEKSEHEYHDDNFISAVSDHITLPNVPSFNPLHNVIIKQSNLTQQNEADHTTMMHNLIDPTFRPHDKSKTVVQLMIIFPDTDSCDYSILNFCQNIKQLEDVCIGRYDKRIMIDGGFKGTDMEKEIQHTAVFISLDKAVWKIIKDKFNADLVKEVETIEGGFEDKPVELEGKVDMDMFNFEDVELEDMNVGWRLEKYENTRKRKLGEGRDIGSLGRGGITGLLGRMAL